MLPNVAYAIQSVPWLLPLCGRMSHVAWSRVVPVVPVVLFGVVIGCLVVLVGLCVVVIGLLVAYKLCFDAGCLLRRRRPRIGFSTKSKRAPWDSITNRLKQSSQTVTSTLL